jgi:putative membrane protein
MKNTLLLTAFAVVCFGPASVVAMTHQKPQPINVYYTTAQTITPSVPAQPPQTEPTQDPARQDQITQPGDPTTEAVTTEMYVTQAAVADMFEIESSKLALEKTTNADVKRFAQMMIDEHTKSSEGLKTAAASAGPTASVPATLDLKHQGLLDELKAKASGGEFDRAYIEAQTKGHEDALKLHRSYAEQGDHGALKQHAAGAVPIVTAHLEQAQKISMAVKGS